LSLSLADAMLTSDLNKAVFRLEAGGRFASSAQPPWNSPIAMVRLRPARASLLVPDTRSRLRPASLTGSNTSRWKWCGRAVLATRLCPLPCVTLPAEPVYGSPGSFTTVPEAKVKENRLLPGPLEVAGLEDRFFVDVFLPDAPDAVFEWTGASGIHRNGKARNCHSRSRPPWGPRSPSR